MDRDRLLLDHLMPTAVAALCASAAVISGTDPRILIITPAAGWLFWQIGANTDSRIYKALWHQEPDNN
jgi:hypothetical protein